MSHYCKYHDSSSDRVSSFRCALCRNEVWTKGWEAYDTRRLTFQMQTKLRLREAKKKESATYSVAFPKLTY